MSKNMLLCTSCADGLKEVRNVVLLRVLGKKCKCEECQRQKYCDEYQVSRKGENGEKVRPASL